MKTVTCDKCGRVMPFRHPWMQAQFPIVMISVLSEIADNPRSIDLCTDCSREFMSWLEESSKEEPKRGRWTDVGSLSTGCSECGCKSSMGGIHGDQ